MFAGVLIESAKEAEQALAAGACAITTSNVDL
ncbi:glycerol-3-phosphate responsive antiterminator [Bacillus smithii]